MAVFKIKYKKSASSRKIRLGAGDVGKAYTAPKHLASCWWEIATSAATKQHRPIKEQARPPRRSCQFYRSSRK